VAAASGVSRSTVSRVVNGSTAVSPEALTAVQAAIARLNYVPNRAARSLASRQTHAIALVVPEDTARFFGDPYFAAIVAGINARMSESEYILTLLIASDDPGDKVTRFVLNGGVDGALIISHHTSDSFVERIAQAVPVVFGGRPIPARAADYIVDIDNIAGARAATAHLVSRGCRKIATITGALTMPAGSDRLSGFRAALTDANQQSTGEYNADFSEQGGADAARRMLASGKELPDGLFIASDLMARGALGVLRAAGLRVPEDIAVVGFDDSPIAVAVDPALTTVRQPTREQGEAMVDVLLKVLAGGDATHLTTLPTELVVRASA